MSLIPKDAKGIWTSKWSLFWDDLTTVDQQMIATSEGKNVIRERRLPHHNSLTCNDVQHHIQLYSIKQLNYSLSSFFYIYTSGLLRLFY